MGDLEINFGFIDEDVIALCDDADGHYAFYAALKGDRYITRMASSHGFISNNSFHKSTGTRQMVMKAMSYHLDLLEEIEAGNIEMMPPRETTH